MKMIFFHCTVLFVMSWHLGVESLKPTGFLRKFIERDSERNCEHNAETLKKLEILFENSFLFILRNRTMLICVSVSPSVWRESFSSLHFESTGPWNWNKITPGKTVNQRKSATKLQDQKNSFSRTANESLNSEQLPTSPWLTILKIHNWFLK